MKRKNLNSLKLNKKSISSLQVRDLTGGNAGSWLFPGCDSHPKICGSHTCPSVANDCPSIDFGCNTTDPGEIGPCTETVR
ncbi:hypothetical protein [uncultured Kordia sp.]|uniref:hypothetical protein n=1 Tax=uncultured Kordia sp. TaxID=507699 RepID=UPI0026231B72|nr:hypothetical protein [uncultured Kordia sp.]